MSDMEIEEIEEMIEELTDDTKQEKTTRVQLLKRYIPSVPEESEQATYLTQKQANGLNEMQMWAEMLEEPEAEIIKEHISRVERRSMSIDGKGREDITRMLCNRLDGDTDTEDMHTLLAFRMAQESQDGDTSDISIS